MIEISFAMDRLAGWEKIRYARAISVIIRELKELRKAIEEVAIAEVDFLIIMK